MDKHIFEAFETLLDYTKSTCYLDRSSMILLSFELVMDLTYLDKGL